MLKSGKKNRILQFSSAAYEPVKVCLMKFYRIKKKDKRKGQSYVFQLAGEWSAAELTGYLRHRYLFTLSPFPPPPPPADLTTNQPKPYRIRKAKNE